MERYKKVIIVLVAFLSTAMFTVGSVQAQQGLIADDVCAGNTNSIICKKKATGEQEVKNTVKTVINSLLFVVGIITVIMIIVGGIRYATSNGDPGSITGAKNTILYAVIGLVIAIFSYAIVNFVYSQITKPRNSNTSSDGADSNGLVP